eukprot:2208783-Alexandrium_andersonii.AAC.1
MVRRRPSRATATYEYHARGRESFQQFPAPNHWRTALSEPPGPALSGSPAASYAQNAPLPELWA